MLDTLITVAVLLALAFPVLAIVAIVMASNARHEVRSLQARIVTLEAARLAAAASAPAPPASAERVMPPPPLADAAQRRRLRSKQARARRRLCRRSRHRRRRQRPRRRWKSASARNGWCGSAALALALGGIFLVRYAIEQDLIGPGVRIFLGALFAAGLIAAGEWTRRGEIASGLAAVPSRHIPSVLTAAGTVVAYATVYAAYALYDFLAPAVAFMLLGLVALATLAAALLHGPALAGLGLVGAFIAPLLVSTNEPNYWALYIYLAVVTAAAFALARMRLWRWLAITAVAFGVLWVLPGISYPHVDALGAHLFHVVAGFALAAALIVSRAVVRTAGRARRDRRDLLRRASAPISSPPASLVHRQLPRCGGADRVHAAGGGHRRHRLAHRRRVLRAAAAPDC